MPAQQTGPIFLEGFRGNFGSWALIKWKTKKLTLCVEGDGRRVGIGVPSCSDKVFPYPNMLNLTICWRYSIIDFDIGAHMVLNNVHSGCSLCLWR